MSIDKESLEYLNYNFEQELAKRKEILDKEVEQELAKKQFVGTPEMQAEARTAEEARIREEKQEWYNQQAQALEATMYEDFGGSREAARSLQQEEDTSQEYEPELLDYLDAEEEQNDIGWDSGEGYEP